jgi:hypothetical protein
MTVFAMENDRRVFRQITQYVRFDLVLFLLRIISRPSPAMIAPGLFDHALFAEKIGAFNSAFFVGGFKNESIANV